MSLEGCCMSEWDGTKRGIMKGHHTILVFIHSFFASAIVMSGSSALRRAMGLGEEQESAPSNYYLIEPDFTLHLHNDAAFLVNSGRLAEVSKEMAKICEAGTVKELTLDDARLIEVEVLLNCLNSIRQSPTYKMNVTKTGMLARLADQLDIPIVNEFCSNWLINLPSEEIKPENRFKLLYVAYNFQLSIDCQAKFLMASVDTPLEQFIDLDPFIASCAGNLLISALATKGQGRLSHEVSWGNVDGLVCHICGDRPRIPRSTSTNGPLLPLPITSQYSRCKHCELEFCVRNCKTKTCLASVKKWLVERLEKKNEKVKENDENGDE